MELTLRDDERHLGCKPDRPRSPCPGQPTLPTLRTLPTLLNLSTWGSDSQGPCLRP
jgi:hypothetical protein